MACFFTRTASLFKLLIFLTGHHCIKAKDDACASIYERLSMHGGDA